MRTDRMNAMEQYILKNGSVSLDNLVNTFHVSMNTVRRDIASLLERGNVRKVYGGVCAIPKVSPEPVAPISIRASENSSEKEIIGRRAANLVKDHSSIFLDSGSTTEKIIPYLADKQDITVITYSLSAMYEASKYPSIRLVALGGVSYTVGAVLYAVKRPNFSPQFGFHELFHLFILGGSLLHYLAVFFFVL